MFRRRALVLVLSAVALVLGTVGAPSSASAASKPYPVPYLFLIPAIAAGLELTAAAPGSNDWNCKPSAAHPNPVVLTHGLAGNKNTNWRTFSPLLANEGYCVFALTYGVAPGTPLPANLFGGLTSMTKSAVELSAFVDKVLAATKAKKVDILGHSEGTVMPDYYAKYLGGASKIDKYVSLAPLWHGTDPAGLGTLNAYGAAFGFGTLVDAGFAPFFASGPELLTGSAFFTKLRAGGTTNVPGIKYTNIMTKYDELVQPYTSGFEPGATNITIQDLCLIDFAEHFEIAADPTAADLVLNALDPKHPRKVRCELVLPIL